MNNLYSNIKLFWRNRSSPEFISLQRSRYIKWRKETTVTRIEKPTRLDRARSLGYKAKPGYIIIRTKVRRGGRRMSRPTRGRTKGKNLAVDKTSGRNLRWIAETRTARKYTNFEVLGSYWVGQDGISKWFEIILVDPIHPAIIADSRISWINKRKHKRRVFRGLTSSGKKARGLHKRGLAAIKARPSRRAHGRRNK